MHVLPGSKRVQCLLCGKDYASKQKAKVHIATIHRAAEDASLRAECDICGKVFKHVVNMRDHLYKTHNVRRRLEYAAVL